MGLFEHYEEISLYRCVRPKLAAYQVASWFLDPAGGTAQPGLQDKYCIVAISTPYLMYASLAAPAGLAIVAAFIAFILCCMKPARTTPKSPKQKRVKENK